MKYQHVDSAIRIMAVENAVTDNPTTFDTASIIGYLEDEFSSNVLTIANDFLGKLDAAAMRDFAVDGPSRVARAFGYTPELEMVDDVLQTAFTVL